MFSILITPFGFVYIALAIIAYFRSYQAVATIFTFSYLFQTTAIFAIGKTGFMPYLIGPVLLIIKGLRLKKEVPQDVKNIQIMSMVFIVFVIAQSIVAKYLFEGQVYVYGTGGMEASISKGLVPYYFSMKQCIQWVYLVLNMGGLLSIIKHRQYLSSHFSRQMIEMSVFFITFIGLWKYVADNLWGWFPDTFFFNNASFDLDNLWQSVGGKFRFTSIFIEASICGLFLATFVWNVLFVKTRNKMVLLAATLFTLLLTVASTGYFSLIFGLFLYVIKKRNIKVFIVLSVISVVFYFIAQQLNLLNIMYDMTINKSNSISAEVRSTIMMSGWSIFKATSGIGIGLGASNGAGIALTLLGQIGAIGCCLFSLWIFFILKFLKNNGIKHMQLCLWVVLFGMCTSVGYLSFPVFWLELIVVCCMRPDILNRKEIA
ncbi:MAG: hypothetical protein MJZ22_02155 [Candidatus Saccharibacteria bacterium]|nr:hypothetical protein [Candidatus Saccharibacteria bacterium]